MRVVKGQVVCFGLVSGDGPESAVTFLPHSVIRMPFTFLSRWPERLIRFLVQYALITNPESDNTGTSKYSSQLNLPIPIILP